MAKIDKGHFDKDSLYTQGLEDMYSLIKSVFELSIDDRVERFGMANISKILDTFDFQQIKERMESLCKYYVLRGIYVDAYGYKKVVVESERLSIKPDEVLINAFLNCHRDKNISFTCVEEIYVKE